jgi:hypothetical protein
MGSASRQLTIGGCDYAAAGILNGYIDDLLFIDGAALNTTSFVPPTAPFEDAFEAMMQPMAGPRVAVSAEVAVGRAARMEGPARFRDMEHEGAGRIIGTTKNVGDPDYPVSRRVRLFRKRDGVLAREMWSDAAGNYQFNHVRADVEYVITSHDHTGLYNAVIADSIIPELIP